MGRQIEATQFSVQDYEIAKTGTKFDNPFKQVAMEKMQAEEKNPKSELNTRYGGVNNLRRIRVMKDSETKEAKPEALVLLYETKTPVRELERKKHIEEDRKVSNRHTKFPIFVRDIKEFIARHIESAAVLVLQDQSVPNRGDVLKTLREIRERVEDSDLRVNELLGICRDLLKVANGLPRGDTTGPDQLAIILCIDYAYAGLMFFNGLDNKAFDRDQFVKFYNELFPRPPQKHKSNHRRGNEFNIKKEVTRAVVEKKPTVG